MDESQIRELFEDLLEAWNARDAAAYAALFAEDGNVVGFDGSQYNGRAEIEAEIGKIFADHETATYVWKIREVRFLSGEVALLRAAAGLVSRRQADLNPAANAIQSLVAIKDGDAWRIALFQNTPAQFHMRPDLAEKLTEELRQLI